MAGAIYCLVNTISQGQLELTSIYIYMFSSCALTFKTILNVKKDVRFYNLDNLEKQRTSLCLSGFLRIE